MADSKPEKGNVEDEPRASYAIKQGSSQRYCSKDSEDSGQRWTVLSINKDTDSNELKHIKYAYFITIILRS